MKKPPLVRRHSDPRVLALLEELSQRPAMNGGFQKLAAQQDAQTAELKTQSAQLTVLERRLAPVEAHVESFKKTARWILRGVGAILLAVVTELVIQLATHMHLTLQ